MEANRFKELLEELDGNSVKTLAEKNAKYAVNGDCLHNFRSGADIMGGTPAQACWGYLTKHLVALRDKVQKNDFSDREDFLEKCQDTINYIRFLWCIGNDGVSERFETSQVGSIEENVDFVAMMITVYELDYEHEVFRYTWAATDPYSGPIITVDSNTNTVIIEYMVEYVDNLGFDRCKTEYNLSEYHVLVHRKRSDGKAFVEDIRKKESNQS